MGFWDTLGKVAIPAWGISSMLTGKGDTKTSTGGDATSATNNGTFGDGGYKVGDLAYEGLSPKQDSITQFFRSFENAQGQSGQAKSKLGQDSYIAGLEHLTKSDSDLQPVVDYFTKLLGGDRAEVTSAAQPQVDQIGDQFDQIRQMTSETAARGGGKASAQVQTPYEHIKQITNLINQLRTGAASGLGAATGQESANAGTRSQLGLAESSLGFQDLQSAIQAAESRKGFNVQESSANKNTATSLFSSLV